MPELKWYYHRLMAMSPGEMLLRLRKKLREQVDHRVERDWAGLKLSANRSFPEIPTRKTVPLELIDALRHEAEDLMHGKWTVFGHRAVQVDDPPHWQREYLAEQDLAKSTSGFRLQYRDLPEGVDIRTVWDLNRWRQLTRLAMAARFLDQADAGRKCVLWLEDWIKNNPPFKGWNWNRPTESGLRLIQFTWMDALLADDAERWNFDAEWETLRYEIVPPHAYHAWRHHSVGSSANHQFVAELVGLIVAQCRWKELSEWSAGLDVLQPMWEEQVMQQFAPDGGSREQSLYYHLFTWELCWLAVNALSALGRVVRRDVIERLVQGARFYVSMKSPAGHWDFGDSNSVTVLPIWLNEGDAEDEWRRWLINSKEEPAIGMWWNDSRRDEQLPRSLDPADSGPSQAESRASAWCVFRESGYGCKRTGDWFLRWDLSSLGFLSTNAHGHLDALHLSIWWKGKPLVVDPGTGCLHGDSMKREWFASRQAHNGPSLSDVRTPRRLGPFLWSDDHSIPAWRPDGERGICAEWFLPVGVIKRRIQELESADGFFVEDDFLPNDSSFNGEFTVRWQFAPGIEVKLIEPRRFQIDQAGEIFVVEASSDWETAVVEEPGQLVANGDGGEESSNQYCGFVSPRYGEIERAAAVVLTAQAGYKPCVFRTSFLASAPE